LWGAYFGYFLPLLVTIGPAVIIPRGHVWPLPSGFEWIMFLVPGLNWLAVIGLIAFGRPYRGMAALICLMCVIGGVLVALATEPKRKTA
jgi:hypothetical protein